MVDIFAAEYKYAVGAGEDAGEFGEDPYRTTTATQELDLGLVASIQNFLADEITGLDGRDVTGVQGEEGGPPSIKALRGSFPLSIPRCRTVDFAFLVAYMMGGKKLIGSPAAAQDTVGKEVLSRNSVTAGDLAWYAMYPSATVGELKRFTLEAINSTVGGRFLDCAINSARFRMEVGATARSLAATCDIIVPSAKGLGHASQPAAATSGLNAELNAGQMVIRLSKKSGDRLKENWQTTSTRNAALALGKSPSVIIDEDGTVFDITSDCEYWEWNFQNNVDIDRAYKFNSGVRMGELNRGQRSQTLEFGIPLGLDDNDYLADALAQTPFSAEIIVRGAAYTDTEVMFTSGFRVIFPTLYLRSVPLYLVGPQIYQRLQLEAKEGTGVPTVWVDAIVPTLTTKLAGANSPLTLT